MFDLQVFLILSFYFQLDFKPHPKPRTALTISLKVFLRHLALCFCGFLRAKIGEASLLKTTAPTCSPAYPVSHRALGLIWLNPGSGPSTCAVQGYWWGRMEITSPLSGQRSEPYAACGRRCTWSFLSVMVDKVLTGE